LLLLLLRLRLLLRCLSQLLLTFVGARKPEPQLPA